MSRPDIIVYGLHPHSAPAGGERVAEATYLAAKRIHTARPDLSYRFVDLRSEASWPAQRRLRHETGRRLLPSDVPILDIGGRLCAGFDPAVVRRALRRFGRAGGEASGPMGDPNVINGEKAYQDPAASFALLAERWKQLTRWLGQHAGLVPEIAGARDDWEQFARNWGSSHNWKIGAFAPGMDPLNDQLEGKARDLAVAESNAHAHGYRVPMLKIEGEPASMTANATYAVARVDKGKPTGEESPGPTSPAEAAKLHDATVIPPPPAPSNETLHPLAHAIVDPLPTPHEAGNFALTVALFATVLGGLYIVGQSGAVATHR